MYRAIILLALAGLASTVLWQSPAINAADKADEAAVCPMPQAPKPEEQMRMLFEDISFLNLLNALNLNEKQITDIIACNKDAQAIREEAGARNEKLLKECVAAYQTLKDTLEKNQQVPQETEQRAFRIEQAVKKELQTENNRRLKEVESKLDGVFSDAQKEVINTFNPCLIPPKNLKDPVRAGQASDNTMFSNMLKRLRGIPDKEWQTRQDDFVQRFMGDAQQHIGKLTEDEYAKEKERIIGLVDKARAMNDAEFELNLPQLSESLKPTHKVKELRQELSSMEEQRFNMLGRTGHFFLKPNITPILTKRLELVKSGK
ncbi:MAG: hypothetical protein WC980_05335 [Candidatus Brocadiia bacterium]